MPEKLRELPQAFRAAVVCSRSPCPIAPPPRSCSSICRPASSCSTTRGVCAGGNPAAERLLGTLPEDGSDGLLRAGRLPPPGHPAGVALHLRGGARARRAGRRAAGPDAGRRRLADGRAARRAAGSCCTCAPTPRPPGAADERLRIRVLGPMQLEAGGAVLEGDWLAHRPGQVLKYLVAARGRAGRRRRAARARSGRRPTARPPRPTCARRSTRCATGWSPTASARRPRATSPGAAAAATSWSAGWCSSTPTCSPPPPRRGWPRCATATARARRPRSPGPRRSTAATSWPTSPTPSGRCPSARGCARWRAACCARSPGIRVRAGELDAASELLQRLAELEPLDVEAQRQLLTLLLRRGRRTRGRAPLRGRRPPLPPRVRRGAGLRARRARPRPRTARARRSSRRPY